MQQSYSQQKRTWIEDFDGTVSFKQDPAGSWRSNTTYYLSSLSGASVSKSYLGLVPHNVGDTTYLESTTAYDFEDWTNVQLRFSHICKISPDDQALVQFKRPYESAWKTIDKDWYEGSAVNYASINGFNASSYPNDWNPNTITTLPQHSWWKEEVFTLSNDLAGETGVLIRFVLIHGSTANTQVAFGWLLENIEITAADFVLSPPVVEFIAPLYKDTVYTTGPFDITARVESTTNSPLVHPQLDYTIKQPGGQTLTGSILMDSASVNTWKATIPQYTAGTEVSYSITAKDSTGNDATATSGFYIKATGGETGYVIIGTGTTTNYYTPINLRYNYSWTRQLYLAEEIHQASQGGIITKLAWDYAYTGAWNKTTQTCYFKMVDDTYMSSNTYAEPIIDGATQVWKGSINATGAGWVEIDLDAPLCYLRERIYWFIGTMKVLLIWLLILYSIIQLHLLT